MKPLKARVSVGDISLNADVNGKRLLLIYPNSDAGGWTLKNVKTAHIISYKDLDAVLKAVKNLGFEAPVQELLKFIDACKKLKRFDVLDYGSFEYLDNPIIMQAIQKFGLESKQVKALKALYKD